MHPFDHLDVQLHFSLSPHILSVNNQLFEREKRVAGAAHSEQFIFTVVGGVTGGGGGGGARSRRGRDRGEIKSVISHRPRRQGGENCKVSHITRRIGA